MTSIFKIILATLFLSGLSLTAETKDERETRKRETKEAKAREDFRKNTIPKIEQFIHEKYVHGNKDKRSRLEKEFKSITDKIKKKPSNKNKLSSRLAAIKKNLELLYLYEDYYKTFIAMNSAIDKNKDYKAYRENFQKLRNYQAKYKKLTKKKFPNFGEEYEKSLK